MAETILKDCFVRIGATGSSGTITSVTGNVKAVTISYRRELQEVTAMTDDSRMRLGGLYDADWTLDIYQNWASTNGDKLFWNMVGSSGVFLAVRPTTAIRSATNPEYRGQVLLPEYTPVAGTVGDVAMHSVKFTGNGVVSRVTSAT